MTRFVWLLVCTYAVLAITSALDAATVDLGLAVNAFQGAWELWAWSSAGDNDGIAGYRAEIGSYVAGQQTSPFAVSGDSPVARFTVGGEDIPNALTGDIIFAGMNSFDPPSILYGVGSPDIPGRIPVQVAPPGSTARQIPW